MATLRLTARRALKADGSLPTDPKQRSSNCLNNLIEQDYRGVTQRIASSRSVMWRSRSPALS
jgi:transposase-like protein